MDELLQLWGLQHCQEILQENSIGDFDTVEELIDNPDDFKELFLVLGVRLKLKNMCKSISTKEIIEISTKAALVPNVTPVPKAVRVPEPPPILPTAQVLPVEMVRIERIAREPRTQAVANCDLKQVLNEHPFGPSILDTYQKKNLLDNVCQSYLCDIIVLHFLKCSKSRLENNDFEFLSYKIKELFPNECNQTYYVPPLPQNVSRSGKSVMSKGKLVDKYRNGCTFIRAAKSSTISNTQVQALVAETVTDNEAALNSKEWLKDNREEVEVFKHWSTSYSLRVADTDNQQNKSFSSITSNWPILKELIGYKLIHSDFSTKFSTSYEHFTSNWVKSKSLSVFAFVKVNGTIFRKFQAIQIGVNKDNDPTFGIITNVIKNDTDEIFFLYNECQTLGFNDHYQGYELILPNKKACEKLYKFHCDYFVRPMKTHKTATGKLFISRRDLY